MIKATFGLTKEPFNREAPALLPQQKQILEIIKIHAQHGGFSVVVGSPGVGKSILREHIEAMNKEKNVVVASFSRTMHTYLNILKQLALSFKIDVPGKDLEKALIRTAFEHIRDRKTLYTLIDEAHLLDYLSMNVNEDIKSRITYSKNILPLSDHELEQYIIKELEAVRLGANTYDSAATELITCSAQGNLRLCRNLCYGSLIEACRENQRIVTISHVNNVLIQPHWRSHEELLKQQVN